MHTGARGSWQPEKLHSGRSSIRLHFGNAPAFHMPKSLHLPSQSTDNGRKSALFELLYQSIAYPTRFQFQTTASTLLGLFGKRLVPNPYNDGKNPLSLWLLLHLQ